MMVSAESERSLGELRRKTALQQYVIITEQRGLIRMLDKRYTIMLVYGKVWSFYLSLLEIFNY